MEGLASGDAELKAAQQGPGGKRRVEVIQGAQRAHRGSSSRPWAVWTAEVPHPPRGALWAAARLTINNDGTGYHR